MKKILLFMFGFIFLISSTSSFAATVTTSPTPSLSASPSASITPSQAQEIQEKIKNLVKETLSATESAWREKINQKILVGYVGTVQSINSENISLDTKDESLQITTDENTVFIKTGAPIKISSLALSDKIIVIGTLLKEDIVLGKRIVIIANEPNPIISGTVVAKVSSVDTKKKIVGLTINNIEVLYSLTKKSTIKIDDIKPGITIFAITKKYEGKDLLSRAKILN